MGNRKGRPATFEAFIKKRTIKRGKRDAGGIDWWRVSDKYFIPLLDPWVKELQAKEDLIAQTRASGERKIRIALDNAPAHKSKETGRVLTLLEIARVIWPAQSPDLNAIEHAWDYIRAQIRKRKHRPRTDAEVIAAWEEEWLKIPVETINKWVLSIEDALKKCIASGGDNSYHG